MVNRVSLLFLLLILTSTFLTVLSEKFILTKDLYYDFFISQLRYERIGEIIDFQKKWNWLTYLLMPIFYLLKFLLLSMWLLCGAILFSKKISFRQIFKVVIIAEFIWLIPSFLALIWFGFIDTNYSLIDIQNFQPLSLLSLFDASEVEPWLIYPLKSINLFEVGYVTVLAFALKNISEIDLNEALTSQYPYTAQPLSPGLYLSPS